MMRKAVMASLLGCATFLGAPATWAGFGGFLKIDGINGSSIDAEHPQWIPLTSFSWNDPSAPKVEQFGPYGQPPPASGAGILTITRPVADEIPELKRLCVSKQVLPEVLLSHPRESLPRRLLRRGESDLRNRYPPFVQFKLLRVSASKCLHVPGAEGEVMALRFEAIEWLNVKPPELRASSTEVGSR